MDLWPAEEPPLKLIENLWASLSTSGFDEYFTDSDWVGAVMLLVGADALLKETIRSGTVSALKSAELRGILGDLLVTESARRRLQIEVQRADLDAPRPAPVSHLQLAQELQ
ncbi:hypothetical protein FB470_006434 [Amycolatopsis thermophila]|uniref:Uncharacterized protein n=1 Tax=Amycolatopsis thermophila TaxID=206084 RepID=A0ABU0F4D4_9PSEU|nr:hypothetical protein [Amycolatopsis thermophila]MDQ0382440.1 hypothetical protein [Amycolatopsis thermophila]